MYRYDEISNTIHRKFCKYAYLHLQIQIERHAAVKCLHTETIVVSQRYRELATQNRKPHVKNKIVNINKIVII